MTEAQLERRLAAILAADVAGYSRLMGADEVSTLTALKAHRREIVDPAIAAHRGRIVKTTGDGILVEFASAVDAVTRAVAVQKKWRTKPPKGRESSSALASTLAAAGLPNIAGQGSLMMPGGEYLAWLSPSSA